VIDGGVIQYIGEKKMVKGRQNKYIYYLSSCQRAIPIVSPRCEEGNKRILGVAAGQTRGPTNGEGGRGTALADGRGSNLAPAL
jgi:hypothetical protein